MSTELENKPKCGCSCKKYALIIAVVLSVLILSHARLFFKPHQLPKGQICVVCISNPAGVSNPETIITGWLKEINRDFVVLELQQSIDSVPFEDHKEICWISRKNIIYIRTDGGLQKN